MPYLRTGQSVVVDFGIGIWESQEARDAYMKTMLKTDVDNALPGLTREVYSVLNSK